MSGLDFELSKKLSQVSPLGMKRARKYMQRAAKVTKKTEGGRTLITGTLHTYI